MKKKFKILMCSALMVSLLVGGTLNMKLKANNDDLNPYILEEKIERTIPLDMKDSQSKIMKTIANIFVRNLETVEVGDKVIEYGFMDIEVNGRYGELVDQSLVYDGKLYLSASDLANQLSEYFHSTKDKDKLTTPANVTRAITLAHTKIPSIRYKGRLYLPTDFLINKMNLKVQLDNDYLVIDTQI